MQGELNSILEDYKTSLPGHNATVPELHGATHFLLSISNRRETKTKNGEHSFYKTKTKKQRARREEQVGLKRFAVQTRPRLGYGRYRGWKFFIVVWNGATVIDSVSKTKTHVIILCSFSSFRTPADTSNINRKA